MWWASRIDRPTFSGRPAAVTIAVTLTPSGSTTYIAIGYAIDWTTTAVAAAAGSSQPRSTCPAPTRLPTGSASGTRIAQTSAAPRPNRAVTLTSEGPARPAARARV